MNEPLITIIIPVYNAEEYIKRCLNSILNQTFNDFEVICINDGSSDNSGKIIKDYAQRDGRIVYIEQENKGVSTARQVGLNLARGLYIIHADPDDWVELNWLDKLYYKAISNDYDMVLCDFTRIYKDFKEVVKQCPRSLSQNDFIEDLIVGKIWGSCWNKLVKKSFIDKYNIKFVLSMNLWEDLYFISSLFSHPINFAYVGDALYNYDFFSNENSIVRNRKVTHVQSGMTYIDTFEKIYSSSQYDYGWYRRKLMVKRWIFHMETNTYDVKNIYPEINKQLISELKKTPFGTEGCCLSLSLKGFPRIGKYLLKIMNTFNRILTR